jgi:hypothetical protein
LHSELAVGEARSAINKRIADRDAGAAAQRAVPGIGELPWRERVLGARYIEIGFGAGDEPSPAKKLR